VGILEPILIGFDAPLKLRPPWHWSAVVDFIGGFSFLVDMILTLRTGVVVSSKTLGESVQVDPIKPTLTAPGIKRLTLEYYEVLSSLAFNFNLRRYNWGGASW
jgi:hypothetical protein